MTSLQRPPRCKKNHPPPPEPPTATVNSGGGGRGRGQTQELKKPRKNAADFTREREEARKKEAQEKKKKQVQEEHFEGKCEHKRFISVAKYQFSFRFTK